MSKYSIVIIFVFLLSCASNYRIVYETYLSQSPTKSLTYEDERFQFQFEPVANGVFFKIKNITQTPATLLWDKSYFVAPDNNSSKLLNTDVMFEEEETKLKAKYESILPPSANFSRFTTSALNVGKFTSVKNKGMSYYMNIFGADIFTIYKNTDYATFISFGRYWPDINGNLSKSKLNAKLKKVKEYVRNNNNMAIGFSIQLNEDLYNYKFDF